MIIFISTFDKIAVYSCNRGGMLALCDRPPIKRGEEGKGLSLYKSAASVFQYSRQILKISVSSTSEIKIR